jgi:hypothetical protein
MSDQIKLFKQLISVTTDKESKKQLQNMLNQTMKDIKPKSKSKFSIYKQPASKIKDLGFKTKKQFTEFSKTNQFQTKGFNSEAEFNKYYKNKLYQYNVINDIMTDKKNYTKKQVENEKLYNEMVTPAKKYTTMCLFYVTLSEGPENTRSMRMAEHRQTYTKDRMLSHNGTIYKQVGAQRLNVTNDNIKSFENSRTYSNETKRFSQLWDILETDMNAPKPVNESSEPITLVIVKDIFSNPDFKTFFGKPAYNVKDVKWHNDDNIGIYHRYIDYNINKKAKTFNELFKINNCDYVENNKKANSCFLNILVDTYREAFANNTHYKFDASYDDFCELMEVDNSNQDIGITINQSIKFFKKINLGLCVIGRYGIIEMFKPEKMNKTISPNSLYVLATNGHCYKLNKDISRIAHKIWKSDELLTDEMRKLEIKNMKTEYSIQKTDDIATNNTIHIQSLEDIYKDIKQTQGDENTTNTYVIHSGDLTHVLLKMVNGTPS